MFTIDDEFRRLCPPLAQAERDELERSLLAEGCRVPLDVWSGVLLDGHNRHELCGRHGLTYETREVSLPDRSAALHWIVRNQVGRRNLTIAQRAELALGLKAALLAIGRERKSEGRAAAWEAERTGRPVQLDRTTHDTRDQLAETAGVGKGTIARFEQIVGAVASGALPAETLDKVRTGEESIGGAYNRARNAERERTREGRREANRVKVEETAASPERAPVSVARYATIVADPPWSPEAAGVVDVVGRSNPQYATMSAEEIAALVVDGKTVADLADEDAHLYLWVVNRTMRDGFAILEAWGFRFVTVLTWCKPSIGIGNYYRNNTEHILFGVKGQQRLKRADVGTWFQAPRGPGGHSSKPSEFYDLVESCSPGPYLELFGRRPRDGWMIWGEG